MFKKLAQFIKGSAPVKVIDPSPQPPPDQATPEVKFQNLLKQGHAEVGRENYAQATEFYGRAAALDASSSGARIGLGFALMELRQYDAAAESLENAVSLNPASVDGHYMLGKVCIELQRPEAARSHWRRAHELSPAFEHLYGAYCHLLFKLGDLNEAKAVISTGIAAHPGNASLPFFLGNVHSEKGDFQAAADAYQKARALGLNTPELLSNLANALRHLGHLEQALAMSREAELAQPNDASIVSNYLFTMQYSSHFSKQEKFAEHVAFAERFEQPLTQQWGNYSNERSTTRRLRIGYVSGDFRHHSLAFFFEPILAHHDHSKYEIFCFYAHPVEDAATARFKKLATHWVACSAMSDDELASTIRSLSIDVLIDLSGHTAHNRLLTFARKPAPIQMTWLGYQSTTGLRAIDYRITDEALDPTGTSEHLHSERLLRLPASGTFMGLPGGPAVNELPALRGRPFTFGCLNNPSKITDEVIALWARILGEVASARLLIGNATPALVERVTSMLGKHGVGGDRLLFRPKMSLTEYLALHGEVDVALDTFPYNGGTTSFHSLWMGVPVIALQGQTSLSNVGVTLMRGVGLGEFCAATTDEYVARAVYFSTHLAELATIRGGLREKMTTMGNGLSHDVTRYLEDAYSRCWAEHCDGTH
jgi:protein O-GlcNAc transferase